MKDNLILILFLVSFTFSCQQDNDEIQPENEEIEEGVFSVKLNGVQHSALEEDAFTSLLLSDFRNHDLIQVGAILDYDDDLGYNESMRLYIFFEETIDNEMINNCDILTYSICSHIDYSIFRGAGTNDLEVIRYEDTDYDIAIESFLLEPGGFIAGTFSATLANLENSYDILILSGGSFNVSIEE
jgi:hypothetical protein